MWLRELLNHFWLKDSKVLMSFSIVTAQLLLCTHRKALFIRSNPTEFQCWPRIICWTTWWMKRWIQYYLFTYYLRLHIERFVDWQTFSMEICLLYYYSKLSVIYVFILLSTDQVNCCLYIYIRCHCTHC